jgi:hypothetical protein
MSGCQENCGGDRRSAQVDALHERKLHSKAIPLISYALLVFYL